MDRGRSRHRSGVLIRLRLIRWLLASIALIWLAAPFWSYQIDDVYISARFAQEWVDSGAIRWSESEVIEGYSNFSWVVLLALGILLKVDIGLWTQLGSLLCGAGILGLFSYLLPTNRGGNLLIVAITAWVPLTYWSAMGMEMTFFTLVAVSAYALCLRDRYVAGCWLAAFAAVTRPEGAAWWILCLSTRRDQLAKGVTSAIPLAIYHGWRLWYFGTLLPAPVSQKAHLSEFALFELAAGALAASAIAFIAWRSHGTVRRDVPWILAPTALSVLLIVVVGGDWMAFGRLLLAGVVGSVVAVAILSDVRQMWPRDLTIGAVLIVTLGSLETPFLQLPQYRIPTATPWTHYAKGLDTPLHDQVRWLIEHVPNGSVVQAADVGIISQIPGIEIMDVRGLTCGACNRSRRSGDWMWLVERYDSHERPQVIQVLQFVPEDWPRTPPAQIDSWLKSILPAVEANYSSDEIVYSKHPGWHGSTRFHRADSTLPSAGEIDDRWRELADRYPSQRFFQQQGR